MKFAPVLPPELYYKFDIGDYHMVQAHLLAKNHRLRDWCRQAVSRGHTLIVDNGVIELGKPAVRPLYDAIKEVNPTIVVCPDAYMDPQETLTLMFRHFSHLQGLYCDVMIVPQGKTMAGWLNCALEMLAQATRMQVGSGPVYVGLPKYLDVFHELGRLHMVDRLVNEFKIESRDLHLLGIHSMFPVAVIVERFPNVLGVDSTLPVAAALYRTGKRVDTVDKVVLDRTDWHLSPWDLSHRQVASLQENIKWTRHLVANVPSMDRLRSLDMEHPLSAPKPSL